MRPDMKLRAAESGDGADIGKGSAMVEHNGGAKRVSAMCKGPAGGGPGRRGGGCEALGGTKRRGQELEQKSSWQPARGGRREWRQQVGKGDGRGS